jgi:hypothetical protein
MADLTGRNVRRPTPISNPVERLSDQILRKAQIADLSVTPATQSDPGNDVVMLGHNSGSGTLDWGHDSTGFGATYGHFRYKT